MNIHEWLILIAVALLLVVFIHYLGLVNRYLWKREAKNMRADIAQITAIVILALPLGFISPKVRAMETKLGHFVHQQTETQRIAYAWVEAAESEAELLKLLLQQEIAARKWMESDDPTLKAEGERLLEDIQEQRRNLPQQIRESVNYNTPARHDQ